MYWDRFDICSAYYVYCCQYHSGQGSWEYKKLSQLQKMGFEPGLSTQQGKFQNENQKEIFINLIKNNNNFVHEDCFKRIDHMSVEELRSILKGVMMIAALAKDSTEDHIFELAKQAMANFHCLKDGNNIADLKAGAEFIKNQELLLNIEHVLEMEC